MFESAKCPMGVLTLFFAAGIVCGEWVHPPVSLLFFVGILLALALARHDDAHPHWTALLVVIAGWTHHLMLQTPAAPHDLSRRADSGANLVTAQAVLAGMPATRRRQNDTNTVHRYSVRLSVQALKIEDEDWTAATGTVLAMCPDPIRFVTGEQVRVRGVLRAPPRPIAPDLFDYASYLRRRGVHFLLQTDSASNWDRTGLKRLPPWPARFQSWAKLNLSRGLPEGDPQLELLWAMVLGWKTALTPQVTEPFLDSGTMHLFAISGLHIMLLTVILQQLLQCLRIPRVVSGAIVIPLIWFYTAATGWQSSAIRAGLMTTIVVGSWSFSRPCRLLNSLFGAAFPILVWDPRQLFHAGFQLSFSVVLTIVVLAPEFQRRWQPWFEHDPWRPREKPGTSLQARLASLGRSGGRAIMSGLGTSLAAWLGALPLVAEYFHRITPWTILTNLAAVPLAGAALASSLGSFLLGPWLASGTEWMNNSAWFWMSCLHWICERSAAIPVGHWNVRSPSPAEYALYYAILFSPVVLRRRGVAGRRILIVQTLLAAVLTLSLLGDRFTQRHRITVLPMNGGDAVLVQSPGSVASTLVDTGPAHLHEWILKPYLRSRGVQSIERLILSHGDTRHVSGVPDLLDFIPVKRVVTAPVRFRSPAFRAALDRIRERDIPVDQAADGGRIGPWRVLNPSSDTRFGRADDNALVLFGRIHGCALLFCSDLGVPGQRRLIAEHPELRAEIVVAGIPTAGEPLIDPLIHRIQPSAILLSGGPDPATERVTERLRRRLEAHCVPVFYAGEDGAILIEIDPKKRVISAGTTGERLEWTAD